VIYLGRPQWFQIDGLGEISLAAEDREENATSDYGIARLALTPRRRSLSCCCSTQKCLQLFLFFIVSDLPLGRRFRTPVEDALTEQIQEKKMTVGLHFSNHGRLNHANSVLASGIWCRSCVYFD